jgi:hypothetical protein
MNGFIPALLAVMLAELGPRALLYAEARRHEAILWLIAALVFVVGAAGFFVGRTMTEWADALMIAIALALAAIGQMQKLRPASGLVPTVVAFWRGGTLILVFALAARFGPLAASFGGLAGMAGAAVLTRMLTSSGVPMVPLRWGAAIILFIGAAVIGVQALRLV